MAFIPEDRRKQGLVIEASVARNVAGVIRGGLAQAGLLTDGAENTAAGAVGRPARGEDQRPGHDRRHDERRQPAEGRHRQVAGDRRRKLLIIDEPTRGIDVGTKAEVHRLLSELAGRAWRS